MNYFGALNLAATILLIAALSMSVKCYNSNNSYMEQHMSAYMYNVIILILLVFQIFANGYFIYKASGIRVGGNLNFPSSSF